MLRFAALALLSPALLSCEVPAREGAPFTRDAAAGDGRLVISEVMADPRAVPDERGEWVEIANVGSEAVDLRGWKLLSDGDAGLTIARSLVVRPGGYVVVIGREGRSQANGGVRVDYVMGDELTLANAADWVALRDPLGNPVDSVAWRRPARRGVSWTRTSPTPDLPVVFGPGWQLAERTFGAGDRGNPGRPDFVAGPGVGEPRVADGPERTAGPDLPPKDEPAGTGGAVYRDHVAFGIPRDDTPGDDHLVRRREYVASYNARRGVANWVSWNLNRTHFGDVPRSPSFQADPELPIRFPRIVSSDYTGSGYSRGHLVRSEERTASAEENAATFLMTNVIPQHQDLNGGPWLDLERHLQEAAQRRGREVYVLAGGTFAADPPTLNGRGRVQIPETTWKIAVLLPFGAGLADVRSTDDVEVIAVDMPNRAGLAGQRWTRYRTTVDALERATGYDFLDRLPDEVERAVEGRR